MQFCILIAQNNPKSNITINRLIFFFLYLHLTLHHTIEHYLLAAINKIKIFTTTTAIHLEQYSQKRFHNFILLYVLPKLKSHVQYLYIILLKTNPLPSSPNIFNCFVSNYSNRFIIPFNFV